MEITLDILETLDDYQKIELFNELFTELSETQLADTIDCDKLGSVISYLTSSEELDKVIDNMDEWSLDYIRNSGDLSAREVAAILDDRIGDYDEILDNMEKESIRDLAESIHNYH